MGRCLLRNDSRLRDEVLLVVVVLLVPDLLEACHQSVLWLLLLGFVGQLSSDPSLNLCLGEYLHLAWHDGLLCLVLSCLWIDDLERLSGYRVKITQTNEFSDVFRDLWTEEVCLVLHVKQSLVFWQLLRLIHMPDGLSHRIVDSLEFEGQQGLVELVLIVKRHCVLAFSSDPPQNGLDVSARVLHDPKSLLKADALDPWKVVTAGEDASVQEHVTVEALHVHDNLTGILHLDSNSVAPFVHLKESIGDSEGQQIRVLCNHSLDMVSVEQKGQLSICLIRRHVKLDVLLLEVLDEAVGDLRSDVESHVVVFLGIAHVSDAGALLSLSLGLVSADLTLILDMVLTLEFVAVKDQHRSHTS